MVFTVLLFIVLMVFIAHLVNNWFGRSHCSRCKESEKSQRLKHAHKMEDLQDLRDDDVGNLW